MQPLRERLQLAGRLGGTGGDQYHILTTEQIPSHTHTTTTAAAFIDAQSGFGSASATSTSAITGATGGGQAHNNVQPTIIANKIMRAL